MKKLFLFFSITFLLLCVQYLLSEAAYPKIVSTWVCPEGSREKYGWKIWEDADGDGVYETETQLSCNSFLDRHPIPPIYGTDTSYGSVPEVENGSFPIFHVLSGGWDVVMIDSTTSEEVYRIVHIYIPNMTTIVYPPKYNDVKEISYLAGEFPTILKDIQIIPNPANKTISLKLPAPADYKIKFTIIDELGLILKIIYKDVKFENSINLNLDVSELKNGLYFLKLDAEDLTVTKSFLISR